MVKVRLTNDSPPRPSRPVEPPRPTVKPDPAPRAPAEPTGADSRRGLTERQWFISLIVVSGLLLLITFRGCVLPTGVGPKSKPAPKPTAVTATPGPAVPKGTDYTVQAGDTLSKIAQDNGTTVDALRQANGLTAQSTLHPGDKLKVPK